MTKYYYIYIITNKPDGVLYVGITSNLLKRVWEHKNKIITGFSSKYNLDKLVYYETYESPQQAIDRETCLKRWKREWKLKLIKKENPNWVDLYLEMEKGSWV
jgi:putative endonuclease